MPEEISVHGLVLRRRDAGESDRRLTLLTAEIGVVDVLAKGARKAKSRLAGVSEPLSASVFSLAEGKRLRYVTQVQPVTSFPELRTDYDRLEAGLALMELAAAVFPKEQPVPEAFGALVTALRYIEVHSVPLIPLIWAETKLMAMAGFEPHFDRCVVSGAKLAENPAYISAHAGGFVRSDLAGNWTDRQRVRAECLVGATKILELDQPPDRLKFAEETFVALAQFWKGLADDALPTHQSLANRIKSQST